MDTQAMGDEMFQYQKYKPTSFKQPFWAELSALDEDSIMLQTQIDGLLAVLAPFASRDITDGSVGALNMDAVEGQKSEESLCEASQRLRTLRIRLVAVERTVAGVKEALQI